MIKKYIILLGLLLIFAAPQSVWAQANGDTCGTWSLATGGSVIGSSGSGASTIYVKYVCNGTTVQEVERWTASGRSNFNIGTDTTAALNGACTQTGRLSYDSTNASTPWLYCNGSTWQYFALIPARSNLYCWGLTSHAILAQRLPYAFKYIKSGDEMCGTFANDRPYCIRNIDAVYEKPSVDSSETGVKYISMVSSGNGPDSPACLVTSTTGIKCYNKYSQVVTTLYSGTVPTGTGFVKVAGGAVGSTGEIYGLKSDNTVANWGNGSQTIADTNVTDIAVAVNYGDPRVIYAAGGVLKGALDITNIVSNTNFVKVSVTSDGCFCGIKSDGSVDCGGHHYNQISATEENCPDPSPAVTSGAVDVAMVTNPYKNPSEMTICVLKSDGTVACSGSNVCDGTTCNTVSHAAAITGATSIAAGTQQFFCATATNQNTSIP